MKFHHLPEISPLSYLSTVETIFLSTDSCATPHNHLSPNLSQDFDSPWSYFIILFYLNSLSPLVRSFWKDCKLHASNYKNKGWDKWKNKTKQNHTFPPRLTCTLLKLKTTVFIFIVIHPKYFYSVCLPCSSFSQWLTFEKK